MSIIYYTSYPIVLSLPLIKNTISFNYYNDPEVRLLVHSGMIPKEIKPIAGLYFNVARRPKIGLMPNPADQHAGKWLNSKQVKSLIDKIKICVANKKDANPLIANKGIDTALGRFVLAQTSMAVVFLCCRILFQRSELING